MKIPRPAENLRRAIAYSHAARLGHVRGYLPMGARELGRVRAGAYRLYEWARTRADAARRLG